MAVGTIYHGGFKPRSSSIQVLAKLLDLEVDLVHIPSSRTAGADYLALNPLGKIPTYVQHEDGFVLAECIPILTYIATQYRHKRNLLGATTQEYFKVLQWMSFANSEFLPAMGGTLSPIMKAFPMQIRANAEDSARMMLKELKILDDHLEGREYLVGDSLTIADLLMVSFVGRGFQVFHKSWHDDYPNLLRWLLPIYNMPQNVAVMGELQNLDFDIPEELRGMKYQASQRTNETQVAAYQA